MQFLGDLKIKQISREKSGNTYSIVLGFFIF